MRRRALDGEPEGWRLGLGVLCQRGVAAWLGAWHAAVPAAPVAAAPVAAPQGAPRVGSEELVGVLASMALAAIGG